MPRFWHIINKFTGGEVAPEVYGRTETDQWPSMLEKARNVFLNPRGGALRRPGLHYVRPTKLPERNSRLIPFIFSREQSYMLEFGHYYVRFFKDSGWVEDAGNVKSYLGDGNTTNFSYEYTDTLQADIEVYLDGVLQTVTTDYAISIIDRFTSLISDFTVTASWDTDVDATGSPWVLAGNTATSSGNSKSILGYTGLDMAQGANIDVFLTLDSAAQFIEQVQDSNVNVFDLAADTNTLIATVTLPQDYESATYSVSFNFTSNNDTTFTWSATRNGSVIYSSDETHAGGALTYTLPATALINARAGDIIVLNVITDDDSPSISPTVDGTTVPTVLTVDGTINTSASWREGAKDANGILTWAELDDTLGLRSIELQMQWPQPWDYYIQSDAGKTIQVSSPAIFYAKDGFIITMVVPPPLGTVLVILDKDKTPAAQKEVVVHTRISSDEVGHYGADANTLPYEIQSPYAEEDLEDLYFAQANDVMVICHDNYKPRELTRYNPYDWRFEQNEYTGAIWEDAGYNPLDGYPRTVAYYQERLFFGGTVALPQTLWGSRSADFYDFTPDITDPLPPDAPVTYTIAAYTHEAIEWLSPERVLVIGTSATEHRLAPDQYIATDRLPTVSRMSAYGGAHVMPAYMGNLTVFVQTSGNQVRTFEQSTKSVIEIWDSLELDWKAKHLTQPKVKQITYALNPYSLLLMVTLDGDMLTMTYEPNVGETSEVGWTKNETDGLFKSCASIPEDFKDQMWFIVEREGQRYVEFFDEETFSDSVLTYPDKDFPGDPPIQKIGGLGHLEGKTVTIKVDGSTHPDLVVANGSVELNNFYQNIAIGLRYDPLIKLQRLSIAGEQANFQGQVGRWSEVWLRIVDSAYPLVNGQRAAERKSATPMGTVEPLVTGDVKVYSLGWDRAKQLTITQDLPVPMHITAVFGVVTVNQG